MAHQSIVFGGHFDLGEHIREVHMRTITAARANAETILAPVGILIGDIDFNQKVAAYIQQGIAGVKEAYRKRLARNPSGCVRAQIPKETDLDKVIDEAQYSFAAALVEQKAPRLYHEVRTQPLNVQDQEKTGTHQALAHFIRNEVTIPLSAQRMFTYSLRQGQSLPEVRLYSERELKNVVAQRIRPSRANTDQSWKKLRESILSPLLCAFLDEVSTKNGIPACRGIILALYEELTQDGFHHVIQHYPQSQQLAIQNAVDLYNALRREFPNDSRWQLTFKNTFYEETP